MRADMLNMGLTASLALAALAFSFSVAVTNIALGVALVIGVFSGVWWQGAKFLWRKHRPFMRILGLYLLLMPLGLLWSADKGHGLEVLGHLWFWLLLPVPVVALHAARDRRRFLLCLSAGLTLNLAYCVLQALGYVQVATDGSGLRDATGHIGHIGFGFVYGLWSAWLLYLGIERHGWQRWGCWLLVAWSCIMIFMAQGRGGYILAILLMALVMIKWVWRRYDVGRMIVSLVGVLLLISLVLSFGPGKERIQGTWLALQGVSGVKLSQNEKNALISTRQRISMWHVSWTLWKQHPILGVGTGGYFQEAKSVFKQQTQMTLSYDHPHNQYLLVLARWGMVGGTLLLLLLVVWLRDGWQADWNVSEVSSLVFLSGFALVVHGLFSISMEEHFSAILAVLLLGVAFSPQYAEHEASTAGES